MSDMRDVISVPVEWLNRLLAVDTAAQDLAWRSHRKNWKANRERLSEALDAYHDWTEPTPPVFRPWVAHEERTEQVSAYLRLRGGETGGGRVTHRIAQALGVCDSSALKVLQRMEADGLIVRHIRGGITKSIRLSRGSEVPATSEPSASGKAAPGSSQSSVQGTFPGATSPST